VMQLVGKPEVAKIANEVRGRLERALGAIWRSRWQLIHVNAGSTRPVMLPTALLIW